MHDFLWCIEGHAFWYTEHNGGRQSESSKCDSVEAFRHRHSKKENPHGYAYKSVNTEWFNKNKYTRRLTNSFIFFFLFYM